MYCVVEDCRFVWCGVVQDIKRFFFVFVLFFVFCFLFFFGGGGGGDVN